MNDWYQRDEWYLKWASKNPQHDLHVFSMVELRRDRENGKRVFA